MPEEEAASKARGEGGREEGGGGRRPPEPVGPRERPRPTEGYIPPLMPKSRTVSSRLWLTRMP